MEWLKKNISFLLFWIAFMVFIIMYPFLETASRNNFAVLILCINIWIVTDNQRMIEKMLDLLEKKKSKLVEKNDNNKRSL